jgi:hypothetical protein
MKFCDRDLELQNSLEHLHDFNKADGGEQTLSKATLAFALPQRWHFGNHRLFSLMHEKTIAQALERAHFNRPYPPTVELPG